MSNYIEVINGSKILINDSWHNLSLKQKISSIYLNNNYYTIQKSNTTDIVFLCCYTPSCIFHAINYETVAYFYTKYSGTFDAYIYGEQTSYTGNGLAVYNASGAEIFNSNLKYLKILDYKHNYGTYSYSNKIGVYSDISWQEDISGNMISRTAYKMPTTSSVQMMNDPNIDWDGESDPGPSLGNNTILIANVDNV